MADMCFHSCNHFAFTPDLSTLRLNIKNSFFQKKIKYFKELIYVFIKEGLINWVKGKDFD